MIDHLSTYATDYDKTYAFYSAVFAALGYEVQMQFVAEWNPDFPTQRMSAFGPSGQPVFWIIETKDPVSPRHVAFTAHKKSEVDNFYQNGLNHHGKDNGAPGLRPQYHEHYYTSFLFDPDGNNVEAVCHQD